MDLPSAPVDVDTQADLERLVRKWASDAQRDRR
jgi:hypothetical protein